MSTIKSYVKDNYQVVMKRFNNFYVVETFVDDKFRNGLEFTYYNDASDHFDDLIEMRIDVLALSATFH